MADENEPPSPENLWMPSLETQIERRGNNARAWLSTVETLTEAARKVRYDMDSDELMPAINAVYAMLLGYAIECALKGLWLEGGQTLVRDGRYARIKGAGHHQLRQLAEKVHIVFPLDLDAQELDTLDRLTAFVLFAGRYPIPTAAQQLSAVRLPTGGEQVPWFFSRTDFQVTERILNRLTTALNPLFRRRRVPTSPP